jgi:serine O-acetyltransferase
VLRVFYPKERYFTIDMHTKIGGGVILAHPYGSIINAESVGDNLYVNQLVTIGENNGKKPVLGNNVKLYTNCSVIGDITIGDNVVVGAGAVVTKSVPDFCTIVGNPARIINTEHIQPPTT